MPRISTDNYDTVASWNGSQDLFVVEQPDGTKVATPAMVKQFIEAGDFEATGEVKDGHGNILKDMAKSANVNAAVGDLSQTGLTGDSVAEQLGTAKGLIADKIKKLPTQNYPYTCASTAFEYTGASVSCPAGHTYIVRAQARYGNAQPTGIIAANTNQYASQVYNNYAAEYETTAAYLTFMLCGGEAAYIWARWAQANKANSVVLNIIDITD